jgi:hypothetical protein
MTVTTELATVTHTGNGVTTEFNVPFKFIESDHLQVIRTVIATGVGTTVSPSDYTVDGVGEAAGGTVTYEYLAAPLTSSFTLTIERVVPVTQDLDIEREGNFDPAALEVQLDLIVMQVQKLKADLADAISGDDITSITQSVAGPASATSGNFPTFNGGGGALLQDSGYAPTDFAEADHTHAALAVLWTEITKTADSSITSSTTFASDSDLTFTMDANSNYLIEADLWLFSPNGVGFKFGTTGPASPTLVNLVYRELDSGNTETNAVLSAHGSVRTNTPGANRYVHAQVKIRVENGVNAGAFALQFAQNVSSATATLVYKGSTLKYRKIQ